MASTIDQIFKDLDKFFSPSAKILQQRQSLIDPQIATATKGLETAKQNEFRDITSRANNRGLFYSGMPIQEEARYTGERFLPALAGLQQTGQEQRLSLAESLAGLRREQGLLSHQLRQGQLDREAAERQARAAAAAAQSSTSGIQGIFDALSRGLSGGKTQGNVSLGKVNVPGADPKALQNAYNDVQSRIDSGYDAKALQSDYFATASSAKNGNVMDLAKLQIYRLLRPDLFKTAYQWENTGGKLTPTSAGMVGAQRY